MKPLTDGLISLILEENSNEGDLVSYGNEGYRAYVLESDIPAGNAVKCMIKGFLKFQKTSKRLSINAGDKLYWDNQYPVTLTNDFEDLEDAVYVGSAQQASLPGHKTVILDLNRPDPMSIIVPMIYEEVGGAFNALGEAIDEKQDALDLSEAQDGDVLMVGVEGENKEIYPSAPPEPGAPVTMSILHFDNNTRAIVAENPAANNVVFSSFVLPANTVNANTSIDIELYFKVTALSADPSHNYAGFISVRRQGKANSATMLMAFKGGSMPAAPIKANLVMGINNGNYTMAQVISPWTPATLQPDSMAIGEEVPSPATRWDFSVDQTIEFYITANNNGDSFGGYISAIKVIKNTISV
ncbi:MAG: capsid cement protein [Bacteroidales bacterium]